MGSEYRHKFSKLYKPVFTTKARYIHIWGGRAAGRSHFGTRYFLFLLTQTNYFRGVFLRNVFSDIRDSLFADFKDRLEESDFDEEDFEINESKMTILYKPTGNTIISKGFRKSSGNRSAKLKSLAGITHVLIEEADENPEGDVNKLDDSIRTDKIDNIQVIFLYNPPSKNHWLIKRFYNLEECGLFDGKPYTDSNGNYHPEGKPLPYYKAIPKENPDVLCIHSTYKDNIKNLNAKTVAKYQAYGDTNSQFYNAEQYYVDVCGLVPEGARGRIYRNWKHITLAFFRSLPYTSIYAIDFGYSGDPVAVVELKIHNNRAFWHEVIYEPGLTNPALADMMRLRGVPRNAIIIADSAEPKSIQELRDLGFTHIRAADKGPDSLKFGIKQVAAMENYGTECSDNLWMENEEYKWKLGADGEPTDEPVDANNHLKDAGRYGITTYKGLKRKKKTKVANTSTDTSSLPSSSLSKLDWI
ncbi:PBSX family phage terminase large subunit [Chitinophaga sancti]|uniref:Phage terminase large subunit n=1 Tax=Chitinophaga sancti TaxID=1004 RepID=A0A1K1LZB1_9BACT|nr:phage terminase large subunit [Chitinophaga sancti]WQD64735.1 phage terminase large subunit [Chitinophaga sancti]WQG89643.1 phage terminase large subunit [Chitinophaga sancti]SFW16253.1 phage terminase large subunit [Chitinophaga sancti]